MVDKRYSYTVLEASLATGVSVAKLMKAIHTTDARAELPPLRGKRTGRHFLILERDLLDWLERLPDVS